MYDLPSNWRDQHDRSLSLASLAGRPRVVAMGYTHCTATCPLIVGAMHRLEMATDSSVALLFVSIDPAHDTPAQLAQFAREHALSDRWTVLTGTPDDVRDLAAVLGLRFREMAPGELAHSNLLTLLDARGAIVTQQPSLDGFETLLAAAQALPHTAVAAQ